MKQISLLIFVLVLINAALGVPVQNVEEEENNKNSYESLRSSDESSSSSSSESDDESSNTNSTGQDLLVIRQVVYEIGILTNSDNKTDASNDTQEVINVSFYDPAHNGSLFDLSNIPVPVQTNVSGVSVTGVVPANFGLVNLLQNGSLDGTNLPLLLPQKQVKLSHNISTVDRTKEASILSGIPQLLGLDKLLENKADDVNEEVTSTEATDVKV